MIENLGRVRAAAFLYGVLPVGFLYLVGVTYLYHGRTRTADFAGEAFLGGVAWMAFVGTWFLLDRYTRTPLAVPFVAAALVAGLVVCATIALRSASGT